MQTEQTAAERAAFEAWFETVHLEYAPSVPEHAWGAWQARAALATKPAGAGEAVTRDGWKLVPDEVNMTDLQGEAICAHAPICGGGAYDLYRALLEASPEPPVEHLTITTDEQGRCLAVSWQDDEHRILRLVWEAPAQAADSTEPVACTFRSVVEVCPDCDIADCRHIRERGVAAEAVPPASCALQPRVMPWLLACFGEKIAADREERNHRFLEESLELVQACGCTASEAHQLVDYVFGRPVGEKDQEVGGVMITLAALCLANGLDMHDAGERELARIWTMVEKIRAKQAAKPKHSPLPQAVPAGLSDAQILSGLDDAPWPTTKPAILQFVRSVLDRAALTASAPGAELGKDQQ